LPLGLLLRTIDLGRCFGRVGLRANVVPVVLLLIQLADDSMIR